MGIFLNSTLQLKFNFDITETNNSSFTPTLSPSGGSHSLSLNVAEHSIAATRQNQRTETLPKLQFGNFRDIQCDSGNESKFSNPNYIYPMNGKIYLDKSINSYFLSVQRDTIPMTRKKWAKTAVENAAKIGTGNKNATFEQVEALGKHIKETGCGENKLCPQKMACYDGIVGKAAEEFVKILYNESAAKISSEVHPNLSDNLTFTTTVSGGLNPSITFNGADKSFKLATLGFGLTGNRKDLHDLKIAINAPAKPTDKTPTKEIKIGNAGEYDFVLKIPKEEIKRQKIKIDEENLIKECLIEDKKIKPNLSRDKNGGPKLSEIKDAPQQTIVETKSAFSPYEQSPEDIEKQNRESEKRQNEQRNFLIQSDLDTILRNSE